MPSLATITDTISNRLDDLRTGAQTALKAIEREAAHRLAGLGGREPDIKAPPPRRRPPKS
jgi:hypothetical protein